MKGMRMMMMKVPYMISVSSVPLCRRRNSSSARRSFGRSPISGSHTLNWEGRRSRGRTSSHQTHLH